MIYVIIVCDFVDYSFFVFLPSKMTVEFSFYFFHPLFTFYMY